MSLGIGAYKVGGVGQCFSMRRRYPWQPCEWPPPNQNLLGVWKRRGQWTGVKWNLWLQQPQAPSCSSCIKKKQTTHLPTECSWQREQHQKTAVQAQGNSVLSLHNRRFMSQVGRTRYFVQNATRAQSTRRGKEKNKVPVRSPLFLLLLNSTAMSKELWITNGKDTWCQASWLEMPAEGVRI